MYKNRNLTPRERSLLIDVLSSYLSCDWCSWNGDAEVAKLAEVITAARYISLTYHDVTVIKGNDLHSHIVPLDEFMQSYDDNIGPSV